MSLQDIPIVIVFLLFKFIYPEYTSIFEEIRLLPAIDKRV